LLILLGRIPEGRTDASQKENAPNSENALKGWSQRDWHHNAPHLAESLRSSLDAAKLRQDLAEVERLRQAEVPAGVPLAQWALAWCLQDPLVSAVIPGCKDPAQVRANASAAELVAEV